MKKKIVIFLVIIVTIACIFSGIQVRKINAIDVTQIQTKTANSLSYMIETKNNNIIIIDGGSYDDGEHLEQVLEKHGGIVDRWFITVAHKENFGALEKIMESDKIEIRNIYISFNPLEWYENYEPDRARDIEEFCDLLYNGEKKDIVQEVPEQFEILIDDLYISALNVKNPELKENYAGLNQSVIIKVNNTYKSIIFMGNIANEGANKFKSNNLDEIDCDAVQISNNGKEKVNNEIYEKMTPEYLFMPVPSETDSNIAEKYIMDLKNILKVQEVYTSENGDINIKIW